MHFSRAAGPRRTGALASFVPNEPPPRFKLAAKGDELKRGVGGPNVKNYYDGWALFIKRAQQQRGVFTFLANSAQKPIAIHLNDEHLLITKARGAWQRRCTLVAR